MAEETKEVELNFTQRILAVQKELKAPKGQYNSFGKYKYRSCEDILEAVKPINAKYGLLLVISDEPIVSGDWHYIKANVSITDGTDTLVVTAYARESQVKKGMDDSQITGTASSYARKYALNGLYLIDDTKDADTDEHKNQGNQKQPPQQNPSQPKKLSASQRTIIANKIKLLAEKVGMEQVEVYRLAQEKTGISKMTGQLAPDEASKIIEYLISQE